MCKKLSGDEIVIASHNIGKIKEFRDIFKNYGYILTSSSDYNLEEPEENGSTFAENALIRLRLWRLCKELVRSPYQMTQVYVLKN